jgi:multiple sugar transport system permease protein
MRAISTQSPERKRQSAQKNFRTVLYHGSLILFGFVMIYPLLWMFASSFKETSDLWANMTSLIPQKFTLEHYVNGWKGFGGITFATYYRNTLIITVLSTLGSVFSSAVVAFAFSRLHFKGRDFWFTCMLVTLLLPGQVTIIPQYIFFTKIQWVNTFLPLIVPSFTSSAFFVFMMMQFIRTIPRELDEAAEIDGASKFDIFFRIILPLLKPALITASIFSFYWNWDDLFGPLIYLNKPELYTVSIALRSFTDPSSFTDYGAVFAMTALSLVPVLIVFVFFQRYLIEGISTTGLKG